MKMKVEQVKEIVSFGCSIILDCRRYSWKELMDIMEIASNSGAKVRLEGVGVLEYDMILKISQDFKGNVTFDLR